MIDFRYHIVSLISVFLALAVGIILGAGPLQGAIGDQLTGQVEQLRTERNELRDELDEANVSLDNDSRYIDAAGPQLVDGALTDRRVALVDLDGADPGRDEELTAVLEESGATVVAHVRLTDSWTSPDDESARETVAEGLSDKLGEISDDATPDQRLARALALSLTGATEDDADARSDGATELEVLLERFELMDVVTEQTLPADSIVLVSGPAPEQTGTSTSAEEPEAAPDDAVLESEVAIAVAAQDAADAAVIVGPTTEGGDLVSRVRGEEDLAERLSTVSGVEAAPGRINVPLAIAARIVGEVGQFGFEESATAVLPPSVELPTPDGATGPATPGTGAEEG